jgi:Zn-dependent protease
MFGRGPWWGLEFIRVFDAAYPNLPNAGRVALGAVIVWVVLSITLHELAHGWVAIRRGDDTPRLLGHMTLDPLKHMGIAGLVVFAVSGYAWGSMPVNAANLRRKHDDALVALAGPATNALLAVVAFVAMVLSELVLKGDARDYVYIVFSIGLTENVMLMVFNLLPVPPLDGSRVVASFVPAVRRLVYSPAAPMVGLIFVLTFAPGIVAPIQDWILAHARALEQAVLQVSGHP